MSGQLHQTFPSDVLVEDVLAECKVRSTILDSHNKRYLKLDLEWLKTVQDHAERMGYTSGVLVANAKYSQRPLVLLDLDFFLDLLKIRKASEDTKKRKAVVNVHMQVDGPLSGTKEVKHG